MSKQRVYITSGVSGSGKSTWIKEKGIDSVSTDELVDDYAKSNGYTYTEAFEEIQSKKLFGNMKVRGRPGGLMAMNLEVPH